MAIKEAIINPTPKPGEILNKIRVKVEEGNLKDFKKSVESLDEQRDAANDKLEFFLSNISDTPGARRVVENFYDERHNKKIDASDSEELAEEIPDIESIIKENKLPVFDKNTLRERYQIEGGWEQGGGRGDQTDYLVPRWVGQNDDEHYEVLQTSGTTGKPWRRIITRNDWGIALHNTIRMYLEFVTEKGIDPSNVNFAVITPDTTGAKLNAEAAESIGMEVEMGDFEALMSSGEVARREAEELISHLNDGKNSMVLSPVQVVLRGGLGVALRREEVNLDLFVNGGQVLTEEAREELEKIASVRDIFAETEYPQGGGSRKTIDELIGFVLPLEGQINLVYDDTEQELKREGSGMFGYIPFSLEGQILPGVYMSGVEANIEVVDEKYQVLKDVKRVQDPDRGCHEINKLLGV